MSLVSRGDGNRVLVYLPDTQVWRQVMCLQGDIVCLFAADDEEEASSFQP